uniref:Uncharacterized protein n=1 Tax=Octopus bimaculoides TaxID=37653 RepID=A0A0L8G6N6_OCTBM
MDTNHVTASGDKRFEAHIGCNSPANQALNSFLPDCHPYEIPLPMYFLLQPSTYYSRSNTSILPVLKAQLLPFVSEGMQMPRIQPPLSGQIV